MNKEQILQTIYKNVKAVLEWREISEPEFCKMIGVTRGYFDRKRDDIGITRLISIAETLKIRPENLWDDNFITEVRRNDLKGKIERLTAELKGLEIDGYMEKPVLVSDSLNEAMSGKKKA